MWSDAKDIQTFYLLRCLFKKEPEYQDKGDHKHDSKGQLWKKKSHLHPPII